MPSNRRVGPLGLRRWCSRYFTCLIETPSHWANWAWVILACLRKARIRLAPHSIVPYEGTAFPHLLLPVGAQNSSSDGTPQCRKSIIFYAHSPAIKRINVSWLAFVRETSPTICPLRRTKIRVE